MAAHEALNQYVERTQFDAELEFNPLTLERLVRDMYDQAELLRKAALDTRGSRG